MKKILIFLLSMIICCSCYSETKPVVKHETYCTKVGNLKYIEFDDHEYLIWTTGSYRGGICHSPKCPCQFK